MSFVSCGTQSKIVQTPKIPSTTQVVENNSIEADLPVFEKTPAELKTNLQSALATAESQIEIISSIAPKDQSFENTIVAIENLLDPLREMDSHLDFLFQTSPLQNIQTEAQIEKAVLEAWLIDFDYRDNLYRSVQNFKDAHPNLKDERRDLNSEDLRLLDKIQSEYRRAGMSLSPIEKKQIAELRKKENDLSIEFQSHILTTKANFSLKETEAEGLPEEFIKAHEKDGSITIAIQSPDQISICLDTLKSEEARKQMDRLYLSLANDKNEEVLKELIKVRGQIAKALHYSSWDDYRIEEKMAKNEKTATDFILNLAEKIRPVFLSELAELQALKREESHDSKAEIYDWDIRYYQKKLEASKFAIDQKSLRIFFELDRVQKGIFSIFSDLFSIDFEEVAAPYSWVPDLKLFRVNDRRTKKTLGFFYLDLFPRPNKYKHFAEFSLISGRALSNGNYRHPVAAIVANFSPPTADTPSLLWHREVQTFFHEFGHLMHSILTTTRYSRFSGTNVEGDFVEAPSQTLEAWAFDPQVLNTFAVDYRDQKTKPDPQVISLLRAAKKGTAGIFYARQSMFALTDLRLHSVGENKDPAEIANTTAKEVYLPTPEGTNFTANWGHLVGYDGGYYGYAWADALSQDLLEVFRSAPNGLLDSKIGSRLRSEIYEVGGSRDADVSVEAFLGRPRSLQAFFESIGVSTLK